MNIHHFVPTQQLVNTSIERSEHATRIGCVGFQNMLNNPLHKVMQKRPVPKASTVFLPALCIAGPAD